MHLGVGHRAKLTSDMICKCAYVPRATTHTLQLPKCGIGSAPAPQMPNSDVQNPTKPMRCGTNGMVLSSSSPIAKKKFAPCCVRDKALLNQRLTG